MKIQIGGFDIEINNDEESMSIKIIDASGKELSNNTYSQSIEGSETEEVEEPEIDSVDDIVQDDSEEIQDDSEEVQDDSEEVQDDSEEVQDDSEEVQEEDTNESFILDFESFKKKKNK